MDISILCYYNIGKHKDPDIKIFKKIPNSKKDRVYAKYMKSSKYYICPKGYEVN